MAQLTYNTMFATGQAGSLADIGNNDVYTYIAVGNIPFGRAIIQGVEDREARLPSANVATMTFSANFGNGNMISFEVNGEAIGPIAFAGSQAGTITALRAAIDALDNTVSSSNATNAITITRDDGPALITDFLVTGGGLQQTANIEISATRGTLVGVSMQTHSIEQNAEGVAMYKSGDAVSTLIKGRLFVRVEDPVTPASNVFVRHVPVAGKEVGVFTGTQIDDQTYAVSGARFLTTAKAGEISILDINLPINNASNLLISAP